MREYPSLSPNDLKSALELLNYIVKERPRDILDFINLKNIFMSGRKVGKIPTSSLDIANTDRIGDFNYDDQYMYLVVLSGSDAEWRRITLSSW